MQVTTLPQQEMARERSLGKYGRMKEQQLKEQRPVVYQILLMNNKLTEYLLEIDEMANSRMKALVPILTQEAGATEDLKATDPKRWAQLMKNCKARAEELVLAGLIYN